MSLQDIKDSLEGLPKISVRKQLLLNSLKRRTKEARDPHLNMEKRLQMADYLCPKTHLSVGKQRQIFQIRSKINPLLSNRGVTVFCVTGCKEILDNSHILQCKVLSLGEQRSIEDLINGDIITMKNTLFEWNRRITNLEELSAPDPD